MNEEDTCQNDTTEPDESTYILGNKRLLTDNRIMVGPDGDWGWYVVGGSAFVNFLVPGMLLAYGSDVLEELVDKNQLDVRDGDKNGDYGVHSVRWIPWTFHLTFYLTSSLACLLCEVCSHRTITLRGGVLASTGMLLSVFADSVSFLYFSYGILVGFGAGLSYPTGILIINKYFNKKRALAVGMATAGTVLGTIMTPTYIKFLSSSYGCRGAVLITSGLMLNVIACALTYHPVEEYAHFVDFRVPMINVTELPPTLKYRYDDRTTLGRLKVSFSKNRPKHHFVRMQKFALENVHRKIAFATITVISAVHCFSNTVFVNVAVPAFSKTVGYRPDSSFLLVSLASVAGRVLVPWASVHLPYNTIAYLAPALGAAGLVLIVVPAFHQSAVYTAACFAVFGVASGSVFAMQTPMIVDALGAEWMTVAYSTTLFSEGIAQLAFNVFRHQYYLHFSVLSELYYTLGASLMFLSFLLAALFLGKTLNN